MFDRSTCKLVGTHWCFIKFDTGVAFAFGHPFSPHENPCPDGLRAGVTAPDTTSKDGDEKKPKRANNQNEGEKKEILWLEGRAKHMELPCWKIEQHSLTLAPLQPGRTEVE